jgi:hypothetical protein
MSKARSGCEVSESTHESKLYSHLLEQFLNKGIQ